MKENQEIEVKRLFRLSISQVSCREERTNEFDVNKYKYNCPICLLYFNSQSHSSFSDLTKLSKMQNRNS